MTSKINKEKVLKMLEKHPDHIPIIAKSGDDNQKHKFLVHGDNTLAEFMITLRKKLDLYSHQSIYIFIEKDIEGNKKEVTIPTTSQTLNNLYQQHQDKNLVLNLIYAKESVFG